MIELYLLIIFISVLPWVELRGAIPVGIIVFGLNPVWVFLLSVLANILVIIPLLLLLEWGYSWARKYAFVERTVGKVREKGKRNVERYGFWGLAAFVAIPLPVTGAWTGSLVAWLFGLDKKRSFMAISLGVLIAGVAVALLSVFAAEVLYVLGIVPKAPF